MAYQLLTIVAGLGVCCFIANADRPQQVMHYTAGLASMILLTGMSGVGFGLALIYEPAQVGIMTAIAAIYSLQQRFRAGFAVFIAGVLSAVWIGSLLTQGVPAWASGPVIVIAALVTFFAAIYRTGFASDHYRQEALLIILAASLFIGVVPEVIASWQSAINLQEIDGNQEANPTSAGVSLVVLVFFAGGSFFAWWKNRRQTN